MDPEIWLVDELFGPPLMYADSHNRHVGELVLVYAACLLYLVVSVEVATNQ